MSDDLVRAIIAHGDPGSIAATISEHLAAGADHVAILSSGSPDLMTGIERLEQLAPAVLRR